MISGDANKEFMEYAIAEARLAARRGEIPIGAVLVDESGNVVARDGNRAIELSDPTGHAEILVLRRAGILRGNYRLAGTTLYVTIEPCVMCAGALVHARVSRLVYGAADPKAGGVVSCYQVGRDRLLNHTFSVVGGVLEEQCGGLMREFFALRRKK